MLTHNSSRKLPFPARNVQEVVLMPNRAVLAVLAGFAPLPVCAQAPARSAGPSQVSRSCVQETARLCPALDPAIPQPRNQAICLRPYQASLSLACRRAVRAASP